jgi:hypothetical protein
VIHIEDYPYFTHSVKEIYFKFVDQTAATCKAKCIDEFHCTRLIYWELNQYVIFGAGLLSQEPGEVK